MKQEEKDFLLKDLCGRLPYGAKVKTSFDKIDEPTELKSINIKNGTFSVGGEYTTISGISLDTYECKPYLFPLSSMTEEQKKELDKKFNVIGIYGNNILIHYHSQGYWDTDLEVDFQDWLWLINWLNKNHFDYRGLIEKGLAIDATNLEIYK